MSPATSEKSKPLVPPDERFWQRYSPHHEFPLSTVTSIVLHGLVIGAMLLAGWWMSRRWLDDFAKPPSMDVVRLEGGGSGFEGFGGGTGLPGKIDPGGGNKELVETNPQLKDSKPDTPQVRLKDPVVDPLKLTDLPISPTGELSLADLDEVGKQADDLFRKLTNLPKRPAETGGAAVGTGQQGPGKGTGPVGPGIGFKKGPGVGTGGIGRPATRQEILATRWRFALPGETGKEHAKHLDAVGFVLGVPDGTGGVLIIRDLKRRPADLRSENLTVYKDAVRYYNTKPDSVFKLAQELRMPLPRLANGQPCFILFLPKDREQKLATVEADYTRAQGKTIEQVEGTWFGFRLENGAYQPFVDRQDYWK